MASAKYTRIDARRQSINYISTVKIMVFVALCLLGVWMMSSLLVVPRQNVDLPNQENKNEVKKEKQEEKHETEKKFATDETEADKKSDTHDTGTKLDEHSNGTKDEKTGNGKIYEKVDITDSESQKNLDGQANSQSSGEEFPSRAQSGLLSLTTPGSGL